MNQFQRIAKVIEAQEMLIKATNNIMAAISGLSIEKRVHHEIVDPLLCIIEKYPNREADEMNLQNILESILSDKLYLLVESGYSEKIRGAFWNRDKAEQYKEINGKCEIIEVELEWNQ